MNGTPGQWQDFASTNDCPTMFAVGASCTLNITFTPSATGSRGAALTVDRTNDGEGFVAVSARELTRGHRSQYGRVPRCNARARTPQGSPGRPATNVAALNIEKTLTQQELATISGQPEE